MASKRVKDGPHWVKAWISELSALTDQFRDIETGAVDFEALGREEYHFRMALSRRDFTNSERARKVWEDAVGNYQQRIKAASKDKNPQDAPNGNAGVDSKSATSCDQFTADGDVREDSLNIRDGRNAGSLESGTSANLYGDAATREGAEDCHHPINGAISHPTTVSKNLSTPTISMNRRRTGGPSLSQTSSLPPVRQSEPDVMSLAYSGEFSNVRLTQEQYNELGIKFGNQQKLNRAIDSLSCKLENGETNPRNHYAELVKWASYREDMEEQKIQQSEAPKMTEMEKSWIREAEKIARYEKELAANERR